MGRDRDPSRRGGLRRDPAKTDGAHVNSLTRGLVALGAFGAVAILVALGALANVDRLLLSAVQVPHERWLDLAASVVTVFGQSEVVGTIALGVALVRLRARRSDWWIPLLVVLVVAAEFALKVLIPQHPPPHELGRSIELLHFLEAPTLYSFPSGHVARVVFLVTALRWPAGVSAVIVLATALTRIYLAEHWPSDVVGGLLLGYGIAAVAYRSR